MWGPAVLKSGSAGDGEDIHHSVSTHTRDELPYSSSFLLLVYYSPAYQDMLQGQSPESCIRYGRHHGPWGEALPNGTVTVQSRRNGRLQPLPRARIAARGSNNFLTGSFSLANRT